MLTDLPFINEPRIQEVLQWPALIDALEDALAEFSRGEVEQPVRQFVAVPGQDAIIAAMPAVGRAMAVKVVTLYHDNAGTGVPTHQGVILVFDKSNGTPLAVLDGRLITEMRTAAGTAAAARRLVNVAQPVVTILGNGVQAKAHVPALQAVTAIGELRLWARDPARGAVVADEIGATFFADAQTAVREADIVVCATAAKEPVLKGAWLKPGAFVSAVGWHGIDGRELDDVAMAHTVIVESYAAARDQAGNIRGSGCEVFAEIGEIFEGTKVAPAGANIIYDSVGIAIMDVAAARLAFDLAMT